MTDPSNDDASGWPVPTDEDLALLQSLVRGPMEDAAREEEAALTDYRSMSRQARRQALLAEYCCRTNGCLLLHVWQTWQPPKGRWYYHPRYRLSVAAESVESPRQKWVARAGSFDKLLDECGENPGLGTHLNCDHVRVWITGRRLAADVNGKIPGAPGDPIKLPDDDTPKGSGARTTVPPCNLVSS